MFASYKVCNTGEIGRDRERRKKEKLVGREAHKHSVISQVHNNQQKWFRSANVLHIAILMDYCKHVLKQKTTKNNSLFVHHTHWYWDVRKQPKTIPYLFSIPSGMGMSEDNQKQFLIIFVQHTQ